MKKNLLFKFSKLANLVTLYQVKLILSIVYLGVLPIFVIIFKFLKQQNSRKSWFPWKLSIDSVEEAKKQY